MTTTTTTDNITMIGTLATFVADTANAEQTYASKREALVSAMTECRKAGVKFAISKRDGKAEADSCPNRKALKAALGKLGFGDGRSGQLTGMMVLYYESNTAPATFRDYDSVYNAIGKEALARLNITPKSSDEPNGSTVRDAAEQTGKAQGSTSTSKVKNSRMPKLTPIWGLYEALMAHEDSNLFTAWLKTDQKQTLQAYVESAKGDALNKERIKLLEAELAKLKGI